ncbi:MAG: nucleoside-triphosphatase [Lachnospiraceae bacterium]|nr:nucleoside-triphosphatase [Lachnospiraceae bacterium]
MDNSKFDILYIKEQLSIKKHIVITGPIGSGKSTLLKELRLSLGLKEDTPGIVTWNVKGEAVYMRSTLDSEIITIGIFNPESLSVRNRMKPVTEGFNTRGVSWLNDFINSDSKWVTIDEVGFLEGECPGYIEKLSELFDKKRVMAAIRKQDIKHINDILIREDVFVINL